MAPKKPTAADKRSMSADARAATAKRVARNVRSGAKAPTAASKARAAEKVVNPKQVAKRTSAKRTTSTPAVNLPEEYPAPTWDTPERKSSRDEISHEQQPVVTSSSGEFDDYTRVSDETLSEFQTLPVGGKPVSVAQGVSSGESSRGLSDPERAGAVSRKEVEPIPVPSDSVRNIASPRPLAGEVGKESAGNEAERSPVIPALATPTAPAGADASPAMVTPRSTLVGRQAILAEKKDLGDESDSDDGPAPAGRDDDRVAYRRREPPS